ncbi:MAG TPA: hypothetical protein VJI71_00565 [Candidatus Norongarragalinales archaeon]|nr:hypothetical protein [Candidatus Norongarragalinales archaeon]
MNANKIAEARCGKLLEMAKETFAEDEKLSRRYVSLARKMAMRHRISLGNRSFCKKCNAVFILGKTLKVRLSKGLRLYICVSCGFTRRIPYKGKN